MILRDAGLDFEEWKDYDWITKGADHRVGIDDEGYADFYLMGCWNDSRNIIEADADIYKKLLDIDTVLGTKISYQLMSCLSWTTRSKLIKVWIILQ